MIGHLGTRVSALLDGQLSAAETERAWAHVHGCHLCRDAVEREGWIKTRLAGLTWTTAPAPDHLKGSLMGATPGHHTVLEDTRRRLGLVAIGGSAMGAAVLSVLALGVGPADAPGVDRRTPVTNVSGPTSHPRVTVGPLPVVDQRFPTR